jgi:hypothetical protein
VAFMQLCPRPIRTVVAALLVLAVTAAAAQPVERVLELAKKEKSPLLETLKILCDSESGSRDLEGLDKLANLIAARLKSLGGDVQLIDFGTDLYRMDSRSQTRLHSPQPGLHRSFSRLKGVPRTRAPRRSEASMRSTSFPIKSCRQGIFPIRPPG